MVHLPITLSLMKENITFVWIISLTREAKMKLCIAEKPSVAREIAEVIGAKTRRDALNVCPSSHPRTLFRLRQTTLRVWRTSRNAAPRASPIQILRAVISVRRSSWIPRVLVDGTQCTIIGLPRSVDDDVCVAPASRSLLMDVTMEISCKSACSVVANRLIITHRCPSSNFLRQTLHWLSPAPSEGLNGERICN